ncbi:MAG TPA: DUF2975 domain-containing protein [Caulobacter sp.]|nr:DUF2975 domain-containing protein [Caulobacter sp.]
MSDTAADADSNLTGQARTFEVLAYVAVATLAVQFLLLLGLLRLIEPLWAAVLGGDWSAFKVAGQPVLRRLVGLIPVLCYLGGLLSAAKIFGRVSAGQLFAEANFRDLGEVGSSLLWGAGTSAVLVPFLQMLIDGERGFSGLNLEPETWVIAVVGGFILVLGRMMARARAETSALKAELNDFV